MSRTLEWTEFLIFGKLWGEDGCIEQKTSSSSAHNLVETCTDLQYTS